MKRMLLFMLVVFIFVSDFIQVHALERPEFEFKIFQFPRTMMPRIDGKADDWEIVGEEYTNRTDLLNDTADGHGTNIDPNDFAHDPQLVGIYFNPINGDVDLTYHLNVNLSDEKIIAAWSQNTSSEHGPLVKLATMNDVLRLLEEGKVPESYENQDRKFEIVYATRGGLENLTEEQIRR